MMQLFQLRKGANSEFSGEGQCGSISGLLFFKSFLQQKLKKLILNSSSA